MKKILIPFFVLLGFGAKAQHTVDDIITYNASFTIRTGTTDLWGDVGNPGSFGQTSNFNHYLNKQYWGNLRGFIGLTGKYKVANGFRARLDLTYGSLYASDDFNERKAKLENGTPNLDYLLNARNLDVKTNISEAAVMLEVRPFEWYRRYKQIAKARYNPYLGLGIGLFHFNPKGSYFNPSTGKTEWVALHDLHLEGQGFPEQGMPGNYKLTQFCVPVCLGLDYVLSKKVTIGFEFTYRILFTDYLDDVSNSYIDPSLFDKNLLPENAAIAKAMYNKSDDPIFQHAPTDIRGTPKNKDAYSTFGFTCTYRLWPSEKNWRNYW